MSTATKSRKTNKQETFIPFNKVQKEWIVDRINSIILDFAYYTMTGRIASLEQKGELSIPDYEESVSLMKKFQEAAKKKLQENDDV